MPFLLGSFTNGMFSGARDVMDIANEWEKVKQNRMETKRQQDLMDAAAQTKGALQADQGAAKAAAASQGTTTTSSSGKTSFSDDDLKALPQPKWMSDKVTRQALPKLLPDEGHHEGAGPQAQPSTPSTPAPATATQDSFTSPEGLVGQGVRAATAIGGALGRAVTSTAAAQPPAQPPNYLPPGAPGSSGSTWAIPPAGQQGSPIGRQSSMAIPNLASSQQGLGPRILAALNPTAGSTA